MSESTERRWLAVFSTEEGSEALREFLRDLDAVSGGEVAIAKVTPLFQEEGQTELRKWLRMVLGLPEGAKSRFQWLPPKVEKRLEGWPAMDKWGNGYRGGHAPKWFTKRVNALYKETKRAKDRLIYGKLSFWLDRLVEVCIENGCPNAEALGLFDHWGSFRDNSVGGNLSLLAQPYSRHDETAEWIAKKLGCEVRYFAPAPWHPNAHGYIFYRTTTD